MTDTNNMANLYVVATPIGNLEDISFRAVRILGDVAAVICEDTRVTQKLLQHYGIKKPLISYHQHSRFSRVQEIIQKLERGQNLALVTDAGTPGISDPGNLLVRQIIDSGIQVAIIPVPGPSALTCAASVSGLPCDSFIFLGFMPHKKGRKTLCEKIADSRNTTIFYESPHRIIKTLGQLSGFLEADRKIIILRELTKKFEQRAEGTIKHCYDFFYNNQDKIKGEFVILVSGKKL